MNEQKIVKGAGKIVKSAVRKSRKFIKNKFKNIYFIKVLPCIASIIIIIIFLPIFCKIIASAATVGTGSGESKIRARVPAAFQDVTQAVGVSNTTVGGAYSSNINSRIMNIDSTGTIEEQISKKIVACAQACHQYLRENGYVYGGGYNIPEGIYNNKIVDCSAFVSWVMFTAGYSSFNGYQELDFVSNANKHGLVEIPLSEVRPGDIIHEPGHIEIVAEVVAGKITRVYNCGGNESIQDSGTQEIPESSPDFGGADHVLRPKNIGGNVNLISASGASVASGISLSGHIVSNGRGGYKADIDLDNKIKEVINKLDEEGDNPLRYYLTDKNREEYLKAFLRAAIVTSYPDLRQKSEIGQDVPDGEVQGIIKIRRKTQSTPEDSPGEYLQYIPEDKYNKLKEESNNSVFDFFTIDSIGQIVVAGYEKRTADPQKENKGGDPRPDSIQNESEDSMYKITDSKINYVQQIERFAMPFDLLWSLLVYSSDEDFTYDLANLVTDGEIIITVCDNITKKDITDEYTFDKYVKVKEYATFNDITQDPPKAESKNYFEDKPDEKYTYTVTNKTYYENNAPSINVTYADTWAMKYEAMVQKKNDTKTNTVNTTEKDDNSYKDGGEKNISQSKSDTLLSGWKTDYENFLKKIYIEDIQKRNEEIKAQKEEEEKVKAEEESKNNRKNETSDEQKNQEELKPFEVKYNIENLKLNYRNKYINKKRKITTNINEEKYIIQPGKPEGKDNLNDQNDNFVKLLNKHSKAYSLLESDIEWLFESMEAQESICDMEDLIKYLCQKAYYPDEDLGDNIFNFEEYLTSSFKRIRSSNSANLSTLSQYIAQWENDPMRRYLYKGDVAYNSDPYIYMCITEDKQYYIMQDDLFTGNGNRNFGFGVCFWVGWAKKWNNVGYFTDEGINIKDSLYQVEGESKLPVDLVNRIKERIIVDLKNDVSEALSNRGITLEDYQVDALVNCRYRGALKYSALDVYKQYGISEQFKNAVEDFSNGTDRANANWILFTTGRYTNGQGQDLEIY